ncbi:MAG: energy transducer TonB [Deltaproteobacteria bacterium]|nr:energy transducer TonB [Deltaproteobacteria bacterium]
MNPFARVLRFGDSGALLIGIALFGSTTIHSGFALASYMRELTVIPEQPVCRAGEGIQLQAFARSAWNSQLGVTNSATWSLSDAKIASHAGGGFIRCVSEGSVTVTTTYLNKTTTFTLKVEPAIVVVDVPEEKKEEPPPPPPPEPEPDKAEPTPPPDKVEAQPPAAAKVGSLLTANDDKSSKDDDPYTFLSDPDGKEYGSGAAAIGGTADKAPPGAVATGTPGGTGSASAKPPPPPPPPAVDLSRKPSLNIPDPCKGFFPGDADDDVAVVVVMVTVKPNGEVAEAKVLNESPKGQGFGKAARTCLQSVKLQPGLDKEGKPTTGTEQFRLRFTR